MGKQGKRVLYLTLGIMFYMSNAVLAVDMSAKTTESGTIIDTHVVTVTAKRMEATDLATPAIVDVYTEKDIQKTGASNAYDVLQNTLGVISQAQGFNGTSMGTMTSKIMIRGVEKGTLILLDGVPLNQDGKYNLEDIPTDIIESIEVVKGRGTVLYGSEATGGVINIRTKKHTQNQVSIGIGNYNKQRGSLSFGNEKLSILMSAEHRGFAADMAGTAAVLRGDPTSYDYGGGNKRSLLWKYYINDGLTFSQYYGTNKHKYLVYNEGKIYKGNLSKINRYEDRDNLFTLNYDKNSWSGYISYGTQEKTSYLTNISSKGVRGEEVTNAWRKGHNTKASIQKEFGTDKVVILVGADYSKEDMDLLSTIPINKRASYLAKTNQERQTYSLFTSIDYVASEKDNLIVNLRQTWAGNTKGVQNAKGENKETNNDRVSKFTPEIQYIHQINKESSWYGKVGKSF